MLIKVDLEKIRGAIIVANRVVSKNPAFPTINNLLFVVENNTCKIRSTNLSLGVEVILESAIDGSGIFCVSSQLFTQFITTLQPIQKQHLVLTFKNNIISVEYGKQKAHIKTLPIDDFPTLPKPEGESFTVKANHFLSGVTSVLYSASKNSIRPELASVFITHSADSFTYVATDSFRLAEKKHTTESSVYNFPPILVPCKNILEIVKIFEESNEELSVVVTKNQMSISTRNIFCVTQLVDGVFPDYTQIIPKEHTTEVKILKNDLIQLIKTTTLFSDSANQVTMKVKQKERTVIFSAENTDSGSFDGELIGQITGKDVSVNINHTYLSDCLPSINSESVSLRFNSETKPIVIQGVGQTDFLYLIMPMNK